MRRGWLGEAAREGKGRAVTSPPPVAAATPHINIPGKSARVKHLFSTRGFSKWRESGCSNSAEATITRLAGRLSICILSTEEFITVRGAFSPPALSLSLLYCYAGSLPLLPLSSPCPVVIVIVGVFVFPPPALEDRIACRVSIFSPPAFSTRVAIFDYI